MFSVGECTLLSYHKLRKTDVMFEKDFFFPPCVGARLKSAKFKLDLVT